MDKLTTEQRAKRYDEALRKARDLYLPSDSALLEEIFPELKESEDEEIRKALICHISKISTEIPVGALHRINGVDIPDILAWLEKQDNPTDINPSEFDLRLNKLLKQFETLPKEELASSLSFYLNVVQNDGTYREEKQGKQNLIMAKSPQLGEQKPANKVEPKFKVGDWVVENGVNRNPVQITSFEEDKDVGVKVWFSNGTGTWVDYLKGYHKWTIEDAKNGDVLADNLGIILFKSIGDNNVINFHAYLSGLFDVQKGEENWGYVRECTLSPATKEQRETFERAMTNAGYRWDKEKLKLEKI